MLQLPSEAPREAVEAEAVDEVVEVDVLGEAGRLSVRMKRAMEIAPSVS